jgi:NAD(P)-dependent dehydrogenase (short-subunit alcohol dehydrogenase family)
MSAASTTSAPGLGTALVTGATSGIGRAAARHLAHDGWEVLVHGRDHKRGAEVVKAIETDGGRSRFVAADLNQAAAVRGLVDEVGIVDVLVNNAGASWFGPTAALDEATFDALFAGNVRSAYFLVAGIAPGMAQRGSGSIISLASMAGQIGLDGGAAYGATKAALSSMTRSWAAEFSPRGVRVNAVAAGPVLSTPEKSPFIRQLGATTPLGRAAEVDEIAEVIAFLASDKASYLTGATLAADGGRTAI